MGVDERRNEVAGGSAGRRWPDWQILLAVVVVSLGTVVGLRIVARDGASADRANLTAIPTPAQSATQDCAQFGHFWLDESKLKVSAETLEGLGNCRLGKDGTWFVPIGPADPRLRGGPALSADQRSATAGLRTELMARIKDLEAVFPYALQLQLNQLHAARPHGVIGNIRDDVDLIGPRDRYTRLIQAFLIAPKNRPLADYVGWQMGRRLSAYDEFEHACVTQPDAAYLVTACQGMGFFLGLRFPPWPWDLEDPYLMDSYLASRLRAAAGAAATPAAAAGQTPVPSRSPGPAASATIETTTVGTPQPR